MEKKKEKWSPKRDEALLRTWAMWFLAHKPPVCWPQTLWRISLLPKEFINSMYKEFRLRERGINKEKFVECLSNVLEACNIYPYEQREEAFRKEFHVHFVLLAQRDEIEEVSIEDRGEDGELIYREPEPTIGDIDQLENVLIDRIDPPDLEELKKGGHSVREIAEMTGMSKSKVQRELSKKR